MRGDGVSRKECGDVPGEGRRLCVRYGLTGHSLGDGNIVGVSREGCGGDACWRR